MSSQSVRQAGQLFSLGDILTGIFQRCDERVKDKISPKYLTLIHVNLSASEIFTHELVTNNSLVSFFNHATLE